MQIKDLALHWESALVRAKTIAGGSAGLSRLLAAAGIHISQQAIGQWTRVPAERAADIERVTGVPRHELRPDLWDAPKRRA